MCSQWYCALNENCHFANMTTVENKHCTHHLKQCGTKCKKKILDLWDVPPLRYFSMPVHFVSSWTTGLFWTLVNIERQISVFFIVLVNIYSADTFCRTVCSIYSFINLLDVLLLGVVKLASRKNWKDYGVLRTCIRELKVKRWRKSKESMLALFPTWCLLVC